MPRRCRKNRFRSKADAEIALARIHAADKRGAVGKKERRSYLCPDCKGWHLTSMTKGPQ